MGAMLGLPCINQVSSMSTFDLPFYRYRFHCRARTPISLPAYAGSTWRGAFGYALKSAVCITRQSDCRECLLWRSCAYSYIFETPPPDDSKILRKYPAAPHPFIIHPEASQGNRYQSGETFTVDLTLIGRANAQLPYVVHAWTRLGNDGVGLDRGRFEIDEVSQFDGKQWRQIHRPEEPLKPLPAQAISESSMPATRCRMHLRTPVRIKYRERLMVPSDFQFRGLLASLLRRLSLLSYFHGQAPLELDFSALLKQSENVAPLDSSLEWHDWTRYSSRQNTRMQMGGLIGQLTFDSHALAPYWPWLVYGQWLHVGKGTVMGLGRYELEGDT